jgi:spermidine synthase
MAIGFDNPKVSVHIGDGFEFLKDKVNSFDIIITDASDPVGMLNFFFFFLQCENYIIKKKNDFFRTCRIIISS